MSELMHYRDARGLEGVRVYAIGDVHGRSDLLGEMHRRIAIEIERDAPADWRVIHLGDYGDRGPDTRGVIDLIMGAQARDPRYMALCGNHDVGFLDFLATPDAKSLFARFGGVQTSVSYGVDLDAGDPESLLRSHESLMRAVPASHVAFLRGCGFSAEFGDFFYCHAGIRPQVPLKLQTPEDLIWIRRDFLDHEGLHPKVIVHGHTICAQAEITPARVNVDTGAYATGKLTAFVVEGAVKRLLTVTTGD